MIATCWLKLLLLLLLLLLLAVFVVLVLVSVNVKDTLISTTWVSGPAAAEAADYNEAVKAGRRALNNGGVDREDLLLVARFLGVVVLLRRSSSSTSVAAEQNKPSSKRCGPAAQRGPNNRRSVVTASRNRHRTGPVLTARSPGLDRRPVNINNRQFPDQTALVIALRQFTLIPASGRADAPPSTTVVNRNFC